MNRIAILLVVLAGLALVSSAKAEFSEGSVFMSIWNDNTDRLYRWDASTNFGAAADWNTFDNSAYFQGPYYQAPSVAHGIGVSPDNEYVYQYRKENFGGEIAWHLYRFDSDGNRLKRQIHDISPDYVAVHRIAFTPTGNVLGIGGSNKIVEMDPELNFVRGVNVTYNNSNLSLGSGFYANDGNLYGISDGGFYEIDPDTGVASLVRQLSKSNATDLAYMPGKGADLNNDGRPDGWFAMTTWSQGAAVYDMQGNLVGNINGMSNSTGGYAELVYDPTTDTIIRLLRRNPGTSDRRYFGHWEGDPTSIGSGTSFDRLTQYDNTMDTLWWWSGSASQGSVDVWDLAVAGQFSYLNDLAPSQDASTIPAPLAVVIAPAMFVLVAMRHRCSLR